MIVEKNRRSKFLFQFESSLTPNQRLSGHGSQGEQGAGSQSTFPVLYYRVLGNKYMYDWFCLFVWWGLFSVLFFGKSDGGKLHSGFA